MAKQNLQFVMRIFGGLNVNDQEDYLIMRSHQPVQGGYDQVYPAESPYMKNIDFTKVGFAKRLGSTADTDLTATGDNVFLASDVLVGGVEFVDSASTNRYEVLVSKKTIYLSVNGGAWTQANDSTSSAYVHTDQAVTKVGFAFTDGHLFIGMDGANYIQTFKRGTDLDPEMDTGNTYEEAYSASTHTIEGTWPTGCYLLSVIHSRLVFSDANVIVYYTPTAYAASSGIWKLGSAFYFTQGRVLSLNSMSPEYSDSINETLYIGTEQGFEILSGFDTTADVPSRIHGSKAPLNHQSIAVAKNWLIYLTNDKNLYAINKTSVIDLGRRLKASTLDGPLDNLYMTDALKYAFGLYNGDKEQAYFFFPTDSTRFNDTCVTIDLKLGEPIPGEPQDSFERRVRLLHWEINTPDTNDWYINMYQVRGSVIAIDKTGTTWTFLLGDDDLGTYAVEGIWKSPVFLAGGEAFAKQFMDLTIRTLPKGVYNITVNIFLNRSQSSSKTFSFSQYDANYGIWGTSLWGTGIWASTQLIKGSDDVDLYADSIQWEVSNMNSGEPFEVSNMNLIYLIGAMEK